MTKPPANVLDLPLEERAEMALKPAVENVSQNSFALQHWTPLKDTHP